MYRAKNNLVVNNGKRKAVKNIDNTIAFAIDL